MLKKQIEIAKLMIVHTYLILFIRKLGNLKTRFLSSECLIRTTHKQRICYSQLVSNVCRYFKFIAIIRYGIIKYFVRSSTPGASFIIKFLSVIMYLNFTENTFHTLI